MAKYDIFTLVHPPYFKFVELHLNSISKALGNRNKKIKVFVFSSQTNKQQKELLRKILKKSRLNFLLKNTPLKSSIGASRNFMIPLGKAKYSVFLDADVILEKDYFDNLEKCIKKYPYASGFAAGIGTLRCSKYGILEGAMDIRAYLKNLDLSKYEFKKIMQKLSFSDLILDKETNFYKKAKKILTEYEGIPARAFQGFNHVVRRKDLLEVGGFDNDFWSAEDRELAIKLIRKGKKIIFAPSIWANHDYSFSLSDVLKRKRIHGFWYGELRKKYPDDDYLKMNFVKWMENFIFALNPSEPFKGLSGRIYCMLAFFSYAIPSILSEKFSINPTKNENGGWVYMRDEENNLD